MGVTHGKKRDQNLHHLPPRSRTHMQGPASLSSALPSGQDGQEGVGDQEMQTEEDSSDLIRPKKVLNPVDVSRSLQDLHKELRMRGACQEGKTELQRLLEKRNWEQRMRERRDQEEAAKSTSPLYQELLRRHERLEEMERAQKQQEDGPEFLRIKQRLRRTTMPDGRHHDV